MELNFRSGQQQASANVSCSKTFFLVNSVYTNNVLKCSCVETLMIQQAKFHVVLSLLSDLKIV